MNDVLWWKDVYYFSLWDIIEHDEVTKHGDEADQTKTSNYVDNCVLQAELSCKVEFRFSVTSEF